MNEPRFVAKRDRSGTWSVIDNANHMVAEMRGVPLIALGRDLAKDIAALLVIEASDNRPDELG